LLALTLVLLGWGAPNLLDAQEKTDPAKRFDLDDFEKLVRMSDPQIAPDGRSIVVVVSRANLDKDRYDSELVLIDVASKAQRVLTRDRPEVGQPRWSPTGDRLAFLAASSAAKDAPRQLFVMPMNGGDPQRITHADNGVQHYAWKPDGQEIAFATSDTPANKKEI